MQIAQPDSILECCCLKPPDKLPCTKLNTRMKEKPRNEVHALPCQILIDQHALCGVVSVGACTAICSSTPAPISKQMPDEHMAARRVTPGQGYDQIKWQ